MSKVKKVLVAAIIIIFVLLDLGLIFVFPPPPTENLVNAIAQIPYD